MNAEVKEKWVARLRSGRDRQGTGRLRGLDLDWRAPFRPPFCCLGVLCEIALEEGVISWYDHSLGYPPVDVVRWAGWEVDSLLDTDGEEHDEFPAGSLSDAESEYAHPVAKAARLNDRLMLSFAQIAQKIEEGFLDA
jgi:hypothetical protein